MSKRDPLKGQIPEWLHQQLDTTAPARISERISLRPCLKCKRPVLMAEDSGWDRVVRVIVDPRLLDADQELAVILDGGQTHELIPSGSTYTVWQRDPERDGMPPPHQLDNMVTPSHKCWRPVLNGPTILVAEYGYPIPWELLFPIQWKNHQAKGRENEPPPF